MLTTWLNDPEGLHRAFKVYPLGQARCRKARCGDTVVRVVL